MRHCELEIMDVDVPGSPERVFTLEKANRSLVLVRRIVEDLVAIYDRAIELQQVAECAQLGPDYGQRRTAENQLAEAVDQLQSYLWELDELGVELQDWRTGRVDFPARIDGRNIYLSWRLGDPEVLFWHEPREEFEHLHPIDALPLRQPQPA
ncbi:MAG: DUF2203 domain-containing protein [Phycisphaerae bacterium]